MTPLRKRMLEDLQIRNYSPNTVAAYIRRVAEFAKHFDKSPELLGPEEIREYQLYLIKEKGVSLSAYIQTVCGLRFLYSNTLHRSVGIDRIPLPRYEKKLPVILSPAEVQRLLAAPNNLSHRTMLTTMYAAGPRVSEVAWPKASDIDRPAAPTYYEAGMRLFIFVIKARNGLLEDNKPGPAHQIKELGQTELRNESFAASN